MTPELAKKVLPILQAYAEGKKIQYKEKNGEWSDEEPDYFPASDLEDFEYRIKQTPKLRPYNGEEEFMKASEEHGPYLYRIQEHAYYLPVHVDYNGIEFANDRFAKTSFHELLNTLFWQDKTPCGIEE